MDDPMTPAGMTDRGGHNLAAWAAVLMCSERYIARGIGVLDDTRRNIV